MEELISPKFRIKLLMEVKDAIWNEFGSNELVKYYILQWHDSGIDPSFTDQYWENFTIVETSNKKIDLLATLNTMSGSTLLKIAIDLGVDTPDFIPAIPTFRNRIKAEYKTAYDTFQKAFKQIETDPSLSIGLANSALESIIKKILQDKRIVSKVSGGETLYKLASIILKEFNLTNPDNPKEIKTIGNSLLSINQAIEKIRSEKTEFHGKTSDDYLIKDTMFAYFVINSVATVGLFLDSYYKRIFTEKETTNVIDNLLF